MTFRISLGMIVRNEGRTLEKCLQSVAPYVDEIVIGLGGESTDNTEEIASTFGSIWYAEDKSRRFHIVPLEWKDDFAAARNEVLEKVTGDYFLWLDGDDELVGGDRLAGLIRKNPNVDSFFMGYDYAQDADGNCVCYLVRERLVRLQDELPHRGWLWKGKVHEVMMAEGFEDNPLFVQEVVVKHNKPPNKHEADRNLKILYAQLSEQEPNPDPRILGYLCSENAGRGNFKEAILHGQRFIKLSGWNEEKYQMQHRIADMYRAMRDFPKALEADFVAINMQPDWPDAYLGIAETQAQLGNDLACIEWSKAASTKNAPQTMLIINPLDYTFQPCVILAGAYARTGDYEMAIANYQKAFDIRPDKMIFETIELLRGEVRLNQVKDAFLTIREHLGRNDEWLKVRKLLDAIPKHIEAHPQIIDAKQRSLFQTAHVDDMSIMEDFYTGNPHWQSMSDEQILDPDWVNYPRLKFAIDVAKKAGAKSIVDWGCSDGFIALPLAKETGAHVTGFDLDPRCIELATLRASQWGIEASFEVGNVDKVGGWKGRKADLAVFFEVIEHVVDPSQTLSVIEKTAKRVIMTTPFMSWEHGNIPNWDRYEPKGHLRIFDIQDMEQLLWDRGRIHQIYKEPWGTTGWIFVDYEPGFRYDKNIIIGALGSPEKWDPRTFEKGGLGGSETACIKLGEAFSRAGHRTIVYSEIESPGWYNGVGYRDSSQFNGSSTADLFIAWRAPEYVDNPIDARTVVLWMHDTDVGERLTAERAAKFDSIVVMSEWHRKFMLEKYSFLRPEKLVVIGNGVDFSRFNQPVQKEAKRVIYSSSPDRGLDVILEAIWPRVTEAVPDAELHVYYGWTNYDKFAPNYPQLMEFRHKVNELFLQNRNVVQHGRVNQAELAQAFQASSVWLYPTYFSETYCITAVEAQLGGAIPITNHLAALAETVGSGITIDGDVRDPEVQKKFAEAVISTLMVPLEERQELHQRVRESVPAKSWDEIASSWSRFLKKPMELIHAGS